MHDIGNAEQQRTKKERVKKRGYFRKRYGNIKDPIIPFLRIEDDNRKDEYYKSNFTDLLVLIFINLSKEVNYAHFNLFIPKNPDLPLRHEGNHMDISYIAQDGSLILLQFHCVNPSRFKEKYGNR
jgi:hypothetical protein